MDPLGGADVVVGGEVLPRRRERRGGASGSRCVARGAHAVITLDKAGWHTTRKLQVPSNISLVHLPPASPELNPTENIWQYIRQNFLSNRIFRDYDDVVETSRAVSARIESGA